MTRWKLTPPGVGVYSNPFSVVNRPGSLWLAAISTIRRHRPGPAARPGLEDHRGETRPEPGRHHRPGPVADLGRHRWRITQPAHPGRPAIAQFSQGGPGRSRCVGAANGHAEKHMPERDRLRQGVVRAVREVVVHQVGLSDPGAVAEREHLHLLDQTPPHHQVIAIEPERQSLPVQDLLADEIRHRPVRLRCRRRPAPLPFQMLIQPPPLGRGHHDVTIRPRGAFQPERNLFLFSLVMVKPHGPRSPPGLDRPSAVPNTPGYQALPTVAGWPGRGIIRSG